jgi:ABC-type transport system substrate-binding protein
MEGDATTDAPARAHGFGTYDPPGNNTGLFLSILGGSGAAPLKSLQVRQALNYAINRKALAKAFGGIPIDQIYTFDGYDKKLANYYPYNPAKAKQLLAAAGYPNGFTLDALSYGPDGSLGTPQVQGIAEQLAKVGVTLKITSSTSISDWSTKFTQHPAMFQCPCGLDYTSVYYDIFFGIDLPPHGNAGFVDPTLAAMWKRTVTLAYFVPTLITPIYYAYNPKKVADFRPTPSGSGVDPLLWRPAK